MADLFYPDANPETSTVDGFVAAGDESTEHTWSELHDATDAADVGGYVDDDGSHAGGPIQVVVQCGPDPDTFLSIKRAALLFDTAPIPDGDAITAATLNLYIEGLNDAFGGLALQVVSATPASNTALATDDFDQFGTTVFGTVNVADLLSGAYVAITLNAGGIAAINKSGITKLGLRFDKDINNDSTYEADSTGIVNISSADTGSNPPYLEVTHGGDAITVTPGVASLTLTTFAPTARTPRTCTPPTKALTLSRFAPTVATPRTATPPTKAISLSRFAPAVQTPRTCTPPTKALTLSTFAPAVTTPRTATPPTKALTLSSFAPAVITPRTATPPTRALSLSRFAPAVQTPRTCTPPTKALTLSTFAPAVTTPRTATPPTRALSITPFAPTARSSRVCSPPTGALALSTFSPAVATPRAIAPPSKSLSLITFAPTSAAGQVCTPLTRALSIATFRPIVINVPPKFPGKAQLRRPRNSGTLARPANVGTLRRPRSSGTLERPRNAGTLRRPSNRGTLRRDDA